MDARAHDVAVAVLRARVFACGSEPPSSRSSRISDRSERSAYVANLRARGRRARQTQLRNKDQCVHTKGYLINGGTIGKSEVGTPPPSPSQTLSAEAAAAALAASENAQSAQEVSRSTRVGFSINTRRSSDSNHEDSETSCCRSNKQECLSLRSIGSKQEAASNRSEQLP
eukprot:4077678-Pleurochrysis_carterae.AAC.2